jgi:hypothetical protein
MRSSHCASKSGSATSKPLHRVLSRLLEITEKRAAGRFQNREEVSVYGVFNPLALKEDLHKVEPLDLVFGDDGDLPLHVLRVGGTRDLPIVTGRVVPLEDVVGAPRQHQPNALQPDEAGLIVRVRWRVQDHDPAAADISVRVRNVCGFEAHIFRSRSGEWPECKGPGADPLAAKLREIIRIHKRLPR